MSLQNNSQVSDFEKDCSFLRCIPPHLFRLFTPLIRLKTSRLTSTRNKFVRVRAVKSQTLITLKLKHPRKVTKIIPLIFTGHHFNFCKVKITRCFLSEMFNE